MLRRKAWTIIIAACTSFILLVTFQRDSIATSSTFTYYSRPKESLLVDQGKFWKHFRSGLERYRPNVPPLSHPEPENLAIGFNSSSRRGRPDYLSMGVDQWDELKQTHSAFVQEIRRGQFRLPYNYGTRGVVMTAGGSYLPVALVSIRMLRETGSSLPVEIFLATWSEWEPTICSKLLPQLNAKCIVLQDIFDYDRGTRRHRLETYQYKIMAIMFSSFEEVLFLDSDSFPIQKADDLFDSEPFISTGLVLWPDFWFPSESFLFFEITEIRMPEVTEQASTEAGEILFSKAKHQLGLFLAAYYNYHGPRFYYPLTSQGAPGEGDKETFLWSAVALDESLYHVKAPVRALGYRTKDGRWRGSAMAQFDPMQDHHPDLEEERQSRTTDVTYPRPFFVHTNFPKLDPGQIFDESSFGADGPTKDSDGTMRRIWHKTEEEATHFFGFDVEKMVWSIVKDIACKHEKDVKSWKGKRNVCKKAMAYWNAVFED